MRRTAFIHTHPFLRLTLWLIVGILLYQIIPIENNAIWLLISTTIVLFLVVILYRFLRRDYWHLTYGIILIIWLILFGWYLSASYYERHMAMENSVPKNYVAVINDYPVEKNNSYQIRATLIAQIDSSKSNRINKEVVIYLAKEDAVMTLTPGREIIVHAAFRLKGVQTMLSNFNYDDYLYSRGIVGRAFASSEQWCMIDNSCQFTLKRRAEIIRYNLMMQLKKIGIKGNAYDLMVAMTMGYKEALSEDLKEEYRNSGASHILAVSGLHVGILYIVLMLLLKPFYRKRYGKIFRVIIVIIVLWSYALITGLSPSVCRACFMFTFIVIGELVVRKSSSYNALFCSAFILLVINPMQLFQVGFLLSYSAVLSILYFYPKISVLWEPKNKLVKWSWELTTISLTAQIGTLPFVLYFFHQFPIYGLLSNFIVIPAASIIIYGTLLLIIISWIPLIPVLLGVILSLFINLVNILLRLIGSIPGATIEFPINLLQVIILIAIIVVFGLLFQSVKAKRVILLLSLILLFIITVFYNRYLVNRTPPEVKVYGNSSHTVIESYNGNTYTLWSNDSTLALESFKRYYNKNKIVSCVSDTLLISNVFEQDGVSYLYLKENWFKGMLSNEPLTIDVVIIDRGIYPSKRLFDSFISPKLLIVTPRVYKNHRDAFEELCQEFNISFYSINDEGIWSSNSD